MRKINSHCPKSLIMCDCGGQALLGKGLCGTWIVQDTAKRRGGLFRSHAAAMTFIRNEFEEPGPMP